MTNSVSSKSSVSHFHILLCFWQNYSIFGLHQETFWASNCKMIIYNQICYNFQQTPLNKCRKLMTMFVVTWWYGWQICIPKSKCTNIRHFVIRGSTNLYSLPKMPLKQHQNDFFCYLRSYFCCFLVLTMSKSCRNLEFYCTL